MGIFQGKTGIVFRGVLLALYIILVLLADKSNPFNNFMHISFIAFTLILLLMDVYDYRKNKL